MCGQELASRDPHSHLLYDNEDDSSSDEDTTSIMRSKREHIVTPVYSDKNIAEPVTSQGDFGPNGMSRPTTIEKGSYVS